jgi:glycolate oxidase
MTQTATKSATLIPRMTAICGAENVITDPLELRTYECDGLTSHRATPALAVLPGTAEEVACLAALSRAKTVS